MENVQWKMLLRTSSLFSIHLNTALKKQTTFNPLQGCDAKNKFFCYSHLTPLESELIILISGPSCLGTPKEFNVNRQGIPKL
jgi:hypothetical protein